MSISANGVITNPPGSRLSPVISCLIVNKLSFECTKRPLHLKGLYSFSFIKASKSGMFVGKSTGSDFVLFSKNSIKLSFFSRLLICHTPRPNVIAGTASKIIAAALFGFGKASLGFSAELVRTDFKSIGGGLLYFCGIDDVWF
ncbi:hypothetical protein BpHYR1_009819 [Brachionus plicatilis]|uniref:Uncharacterized protein n=1 Tax=Brachionus plicatilis TaxID=10195 RepID=A0A3M7RXE0_BRAPC|nr:hypothetical protein BpHYR1_009819 [Brachionus plicatilis]